MVATGFRVLVPFLGSALLLVGGVHSQSSSEITPVELETTLELSTLGERFYFSAQPSAEDLELLARLGVKTVINLRTAAEMERLSFDEAAVVRDAGMAYLHFPFGGEGLTDEVLGEILKVLGDEDRQPLLMHCASSNRVGYVWTLFRSRQGVETEEAIVDGRAAGLRSLEARVRERLESDS